MVRPFLLTILSSIILLPLLGCPPASLRVEKKEPIPIQVVNLESILEENEGLEIQEEDCKEARDFYRGGVQQKAKAEKHFQERNYFEALRFFRRSIDFLEKIIPLIPEDDAEYELFEGTGILFFPNLLLADNHLKVAKICQIHGKRDESKRNLRKAKTFIEKSLRAEPTEWGLGIQSEIQALLGQ